MKAIKCELPEELKSMELHVLADLHIGDSMSDWKLLQEKLKHIAETPNAYCMLNGDLMDTAITSSIGDTYGANLQPMEQLKRCVEIFDPIKNKILAVVSGNHENRVYKTDGIDMTALMCSQLGIRDRYSETTALVFIRLGQNIKKRRVSYTVYATHGSGGGRREGGKINRLADLANIVDADIYCHSHTHLPAIFKQGYYRVDIPNSSVYYTDKLFVNTAAMLDYGGYGDKQGYKPASKDTPVIYLDGTKKRMYATL